MTQPATVGTLTRCCFGTVNPPTIAFEYKQFGLKLHQEILSTDGIRGTHNHPSERTRLGKRICSGPIDLQPGPADIDTIMPLVTGSTKNGSNQFPLAETLLPFFAIVDRITNVYTYIGCEVDKCVIHAAEGEPISMQLQVEALDEQEGASGSFPAGASYNLQSPYVWYDGVLSIGGTQYQFKECTITIDNHLGKSRFMNSVTRTDLPFLDRIIECEIRMPSTTDQSALLSYPGVTAESFSLTLTQGSSSLVLSSSAYQIEPQSPDTPGREEVLLPLRGQFRSLGGTLPLTITNVG